MLRFLSSGESHGRALTAILDGFPAGLAVDFKLLNQELALRQGGYGRSARQKIEQDKAEILGGIRHGITTGAPISFLIGNNDFENWQKVMSVDSLTDPQAEANSELERKSVKTFRPGHADLSGTLKFKHKDIRDVIERASARETAARVAVGAICLQLLKALDISLAAHVVAVGPIRSNFDANPVSLANLDAMLADSPMYCADPEGTLLMIEHVKSAWQSGDSAGGVIEILADGLPVGLGSYTQWDEKLDGQLAQALMSIQAIKAVEVGDGIGAAGKPGSLVHDELLANDHLVPGDNGLPFSRSSNRAGGIEGGMTNGERLILRAYMKPIPTMVKGLGSLSFPDFEADRAHYERSDVCAVPACSIVAKAMTAFVLARTLLKKFPGDNIEDTKLALKSYREYLREPQKQLSVKSIDK